MKNNAIQKMEFTSLFNLLKKEAQDFYHSSKFPRENSAGFKQKYQEILNHFWTFCWHLDVNILLDFKDPEGVLAFRNSKIQSLSLALMSEAALCKDKTAILICLFKDFEVIDATFKD